MKTLQRSMVAAAILTLGCGIGVNRSFHVDDGDTVTGGLVTVNGSIRVGRSCRVGGTCRTVNGRIRVGTESRVESLKTVNGSIDLDRQARADGDIETINGSVWCGAGSVVTGDVGTVNGDVDLEGSEVGQDVVTANGEIRLSDGALVHGDLVVRDVHGTHRGGARVRTIDIGGHSVVEGDVIIGDDAGDVVVRLHDGGEVRGEIRNGTVVRE